MEFVFKFALVILLVLLNGYFVASEFSLVAIRKTRVDELAKKGNKRAQMLQNSLQDLDKYISSTQLGITLASLALGWIGEPALAHFLEPFFHFLPHTFAEISSHTLAVVTGFSIITFLHIVLGELAPKSIALQKSEKTALLVISPLVLFTTIFKPFIWILDHAGQLVLKILGFHTAIKEQALHSEDEIKFLLNQSSMGGMIPADEVEMVYNVFQFGDTLVRSVMLPRTDILAFNVSAQLKDVVKRIERHSHSRFPVYENTIDNMIGFIHIKDIYRIMMKNGEDKKISDLPIIRKILFVPEIKKIDDVLHDMQKRRIHLAIVNDEFGGTAGLVTLEDVIESLVGEIEDEFDEPQKDIEKQKDGTYLIQGHTLIKDVQEKVHFSLSGQGYSTIGGLVFGLLGHEPQIGDTVQIGNLIFTVDTVEGKRIKLLQLRKDIKKAES